MVGGGGLTASYGSARYGIMAEFGQDCQDLKSLRILLSLFIYMYTAKPSCFTLFCAIIVCVLTPNIC